MRKLWTGDVLRVSAGVLVAFAIVAIQLGRHMRLSTSTARVIPTLIKPSPATMVNGGKIFDAVIRGDWTRDHNVSVRLIGYHYPGMLWDWEAFHCRCAIDRPAPAPLPTPRTAQGGRTAAGSLIACHDGQSTSLRTDHVCCCLCCVGSCVDSVTSGLGAS